MNQATPSIWNCARRLLAYEAGENKSSGIQTPAAFLGCQKLRLHLATYMGNTSFHSLLSNARTGRRECCPAARGTGQGGWGFGRIPGASGATRLGQILRRWSGAARPIGLLVDFIGANLTLRLVREVWPKVSRNGLDPGNGGEKWINEEMRPNLPRRKKP